MTQILNLINHIWSKIIMWRVTIRNRFTRGRCRPFWTSGARVVWRRCLRALLCRCFSAAGILICLSFLSAEALCSAARFHIIGSNPSVLRASSRVGLFGTIIVVFADQSSVFPASAARFGRNSGTYRPCSTPESSQCPEVSMTSTERLSLLSDVVPLPVSSTNQFRVELIAVMNGIL